MILTAVSYQLVLFLLPVIYEFVYLGFFLMIISVVSLRWDFLLYILDWHGTHYVNLSGLKLLGNPPDSMFLMLGLQVGATISCEFFK